MSYCRCGEDSDIYMYSTIEGWVIHIATSKSMFENMPEHIKKSGDSKLQLDWLADRSTPLDMPRAGETISLTSLQECLSTLKQLREEGYTIPRHAVDRVLRELEDET